MYPMGAFMVDEMCIFFLPPFSSFGGQVPFAFFSETAKLPLQFGWRW